MRLSGFAALAMMTLTASPAAAQHGDHAQPAGEDHAHAGEADRAAVLATVDRLFVALTARDGAALLAEVVPEGRATGTTLTPERRVVGRAWTAFAERLAQFPERAVERLIDPHVHVEGDIAMIWSRYEFEIDGRFSHCGIDHVDLVRIDGRWRVLNLTWTQQTEGCPGAVTR